MSQREKRKRHRSLLELIQQRNITTQGELAQRMKEQGFVATQTTISRDIEALGIVKGPKGYHLPDSLEFKPGWIRNLELHGLSIVKVGIHLLVLKTSVSAAKIIATDLDDEDWEDIVGTIAGDDTVFMAVQDELAQTRVFEQINEILLQR